MGSNQEWGDCDPLERLEHGVNAMANQQRWESANRLSLLWVHALVGVAAGFFMMTNGTATSFEVWLGQGEARIATGVTAMAGGVVLGFGLMHRPRNIQAESLGLSILLVWDLAMSAGFLVNLINPPHGAPAPKAYPVAIYGGYFLLLLVHILTLAIFRRKHH